MQFEDLRLIEPIRRAIALEGYTVPTPIQAKAIPHILEGRDLLGCAQTGTGKTAAFAWPILQRLASAPATKSHHPPPHPPSSQRAHSGAHQSRTTSHARTGGTHHAQRRHHPHALILAPTRELASQITESFTTYGSQLHLKATAIFGGVGQNPQVKALERGVDIIVATPGRLLDLMEQGYVDLSGISVFVLDEADHMLDMGFIPDVRRIVKALPTERQTLMFSATMPPDIRHLADTILRKPVEVAVTPQATTVEKVAQRLYHVSGGNKPALLVHLLQSGMADRTVVFTRTKHRADKVVKVLRGAGITAEAIHGNKSQNHRTRTLDSFKSANPPVLVATDIAARGIDVDDVTHVINFDLPHVPETYVHRIGRTARAGASGDAVSFCDENEHGLLRAIERLIGQRIETAKVEHGELAKDAPPQAEESSASGWGHRERTGRRRSGGGGGHGVGGGGRGGSGGRVSGGRGHRERSAGHGAGHGGSGRAGSGNNSSGPKHGGARQHHQHRAEGRSGGPSRAGSSSAHGPARAGHGGGERNGGAASGGRPGGINQRGRGKPRRR